MILSTKHLLTTISEEIKFNKEFDTYFTLYMGQVNPIISDSKVKNLDDYAIWIDPNDIKKADDLDDDYAFNTYISGTFYVYNLVTKEHTKIFTDDREMFLTDECLDLMKKGKGFIKFKDMDEDTILFDMVIMNNELTKPLYSLQNVLNTGKENIKSYHEMTQRLIELLVEANIGAMALSVEILVNRVIRKDPDDDFRRPDFRKKDIGKYQLYTVLKALENNKSPIVGLASQNIKRQLLSDDLVTRKTGTSHLDPFAKKETSTKRLKEIHNILFDENGRRKNQDYIL